jgi:hypothetical protein
MSLEGLKKSLNKFEESHALDPLFHLKGVAAHNLLKEAVKSLIELYTRLEPTDQIKSEEPYITLMEFYERTHLCHPSTVAKMFKQDDWFFQNCGKKIGNKYLIQELSAVVYFAYCKSVKLRKKALEIKANREKKETTCSQAHTVLPKLLIT